jgi:hypothetical protein
MGLVGGVSREVLAKIWGIFRTNRWRIFTSGVVKFGANL